MLAPFLEETAKAVWRARVTEFWPIWMVMAAASSIIAWSFSREQPVIGQGKSRPLLDSGPTPQAVMWTRRAGPALALLGAFLSCYICIILFWDDFTYYDNSMFTLHTLQGQNLDPPMWRNNGRFFPLGHQEFNLIRRFTHSVTGYHVFPIAEVLILSCILLLLDDQLSVVSRASLAGLALITPGVAANFDSLIFTERNVIIWLTLVVLCVRKFEQTKNNIYGVVAVVCAQLMVYYKEPAFLLLFGLSLGRTYLRGWDAARGVWDRRRLGDKGTRLDVCLAAVGIAFLLYYALVMLPHPNMQYADSERLPFVRVALNYLIVDPLAWLLAIVVAARLYLILVRNLAPCPLWDGLALGGAAYFGAYLYLRMFAAYYLAPVDVIAVLYIGRFVILSWGKTRIFSRAALCIFLGAVLTEEIVLSACTLFEQKNVVRGKSEMAHAVAEQYRRTGPGIRLFFPFTSPVLVMQFGSYLSYLGIPVEGITEAATSVTIISASVPKDGRCVDYEKVICHVGSRPEPGDLVIVLPDDEALLAETAPYRRQGRLLASYDPRPRIPAWLDPAVRDLRIASPHTVHGKLPDRWLEAAVFASN